MPRRYAVAHEKSVRLLPILPLLRGLNGVTDEEAPQAAREKIAGRLLLLDEGLRDSLPLVGDFLGVPVAAFTATRTLLGH